jgi:hypothetical protein
MTETDNPRELGKTFIPPVNPAPGCGNCEQCGRLKVWLEFHSEVDRKLMGYTSTTHS